MLEVEIDSWSDDSGCSDKLSRSSKIWDNSSLDSVLDQGMPSQMIDMFGHIYLEYFESSSPSWRVPMMDKVIIGNRASFFNYTN